ncbi:FecR domain-containing protein [Dyella subtropica]|uniref:FecR domain-containing protein n=1 Tax=Dyella subtropica TaxID=2992127 RepID=UPI00224FA3F6|nr:FecR domain-containing protein [Dyella subtropica]
MRLCKLPRRHLLATLLIVLSMLPVAHASDWNYRVRPGDNVWDLSSRYLKPDVPWQQLRDYNKIADPYHLPPGMLVHVPIAWLRQQPAEATVVAIVGAAHVQLSDQAPAQPVTTGMSLGYGAELHTEPGASLTLQFADSSRVLMQEDSTLRLDHMSAYGKTGMVDTRLRLQHGHISSAVTPLTGSAARFSVETPGTVSSVRGTHFRVAADGAQSRTEVLTGRVDVGGDHAHVLVPKASGIAVTDGDKPTHAKPLLAAPELQCPPQAVTQLPYRFVWTALEGASHYRVQMASSDRFEALLLDRVTQTAGASLPDVPDGSYAVRVHGIDGDQLEGLDSTCTLRIDGHPQPPLVMEPLPGSKVRDTRPRFRWTESLQASSYVWQLAGDTQFAAPLASESELHGDHVRAPNDLPYGRYYWRIATRDSSGKQGPFSDPMPFDLVPQPPVPEVGKPQASRHTLNFAWAAGATGQGYHIQFDRNPDFSHPQIDRTLDQPGLEIPKPGSGVWYLRMQIIDPDGYASPWGAVQKIRLPCMVCRIAAVGGGGALLWLLL